MRHTTTTKNQKPLLEKKHKHNPERKFLKNPSYLPLEILFRKVEHFPNLTMRQHRLRNRLKESSSWSTSASPWLLQSCKPNPKFNIQIKKQRQGDEREEKDNWLIPGVHVGSRCVCDEDEYYMMSMWGPAEVERDHVSARPAEVTPAAGFVGGHGRGRYHFSVEHALTIITIAAPLQARASSSIPLTSIWAPLS